jgi:hypothetical protein
MSKPDLASLRRARRLARIRLGHSIKDLSQLTKPGALKQRVLAEVEQQAREATWRAIEVASDQRGVVVGMVSLVALWLARKPLVKKLAATGLVQKLPGSAQAWGAIGKAGTQAAQVAGGLLRSAGKAALVDGRAAALWRKLRKPIKPKRKP